MILVVDNYDSFTWNLVHYLRELDAPVEVVRNDEISVEEALGRKVRGFLLSPGPGRPEHAGISLDLVAAVAAEESRPLLGVCLGHQAIAQHFGALIVAAPRVMHGKIHAIHHQGDALFEQIPSPLNAIRYHSLTVDPATIPDDLRIAARGSDGTIQALSHRRLPIHGVQFHPESALSQFGHHILANFLALADMAPSHETLEAAEHRTFA